MTMNLLNCCDRCDNGRRVGCPYCKGMGLSQDATDKSTEWGVCAVCVGNGRIHCPDCIEVADAPWFKDESYQKIALPA
jgi:hypothetical protein